MNEAEIRQSAQLYALVAEMNAIIASIEGMKSDNALRSVCKASPAWSGSCFFDCQVELDKIAQRMRTEI